MAGTDISTIEQLATQISGFTSVISKYLNGRDENVEDWNKAPEDIQYERAQLLEATRTLRERVQGPSDRLREMATEWQSPSSLRWLHHFQIPTHVPQSGSISYTDLASAASVPVSQLKRIVRFATTNGIFTESPLGHVSHTPLSLLLATSPELRDYVGHCLEFSMPVAVKMVEATEKWGDTDKKEETAFNVAFNTELPMFAWLKGNPEHAARFGRLMAAMHSSPAYHVRHLVDGWEWKSLAGGNDAKVVDVGGSKGHCSIALANAYPHLQCVVQDLEYVIEQNRDAVPEELKNRVQLMSHDFFTPQPVEDADVYLLRQILHDWPDDQAVKILSSIVPALKKPGAKILVMDQVVPDPGVLPRAQEKTARTVDLVVMSHFNGKQRELADWEKLFKAADERLEIKEVKRPKGSVFAILELELKDVPKMGTNGSGKVEVAVSTASNGHVTVAEKDAIKVKTEETITKDDAGKDEGEVNVHAVKEASDRNREVADARENEVKKQETEGDTVNGHAAIAVEDAVNDKAEAKTSFDQKLTASGTSGLVSHIVEMEPPVERLE